MCDRNQTGQKCYCRCDHWGSMVSQSCWSTTCYDKNPHGPGSMEQILFLNINLTFTGYLYSHKGWMPLYLYLCKNYTYNYNAQKILWKISSLKFLNPGHSSHHVMTSYFPFLVHNPKIYTYEPEASSFYRHINSCVILETERKCHHCHHLMDFFWPE